MTVDLGQGMRCMLTAVIIWEAPLSTRRDYDVGRQRRRSEMIS